MAHELEITNGKVNMAYVGEVPWHGLGTAVPADLTPQQMLEMAGLDWTVKKIPGFSVDTDNNDKVYELGKSALIRSSDGKMLDVVSDDWNPVQNQEAFEFFNDFVAAGNMEMHTAGSLKGGQIVWGLAKVKDSFDLFGGDTVESHLLFSNFHRYGFSTDVRFTPIRVVCNNTLSLSLATQVERAVKVSHRKKFEPDSVKLVLGIAAEKLGKYKEMAAYLGSKRAKDENIVEYFCRVFPVSGSGKDMSKNAERLLEVLHTQPGTHYAEGSWWQPFNAVSYFTDHLAGRTQDGRLSSAWYGANKNVKLKALELAVEMAENSV